MTSRQDPCGQILAGNKQRRRNARQVVHCWNSAVRNGTDFGLTNRTSGSFSGQSDWPEGDEEEDVISCPLFE